MGIGKAPSIGAADTDVTPVKKKISCCLPSVMVTKKGRQQLICFDFIWQLLAIHPLLLILFENNNKNKENYRSVSC